MNDEPTEADPSAQTIHVITMNGRVLCAVLGSPEIASERMSEMREDYYSRHPRERMLERTALYGTPVRFEVRTVPFYTQLATTRSR